MTSVNSFINQTWEDSILPTLSDYITIPCKSPMFDPDWEKNGYIERAIELISTWCKAQQISDMQLTVHRLPGRTPLLFIEIPGQSQRTVLLYGHMDKQPEMEGWREGLGPWQAVRTEDRLYGRGSADDGYAVFAALTAIKSLQVQGIPHARCVIIIEASEESGSCDLPAYIQYLKPQIGRPDLIICLDSGAGNYEQFWCTTSLRGLVNLALTVEILEEGVHSGLASGVVPSSFRIIRELLSRIENERSGRILLKELHVAIPPGRVEEAKHSAAVLNEEVWQQHPWVVGARPPAVSMEQLILNHTWLPALSITGVAGIPSMMNAGNVLRPKTSLMLSTRIPPTCDAEVAAAALQKALTTDPPYGAKVTVEIPPGAAASGWNAPELQPWLAAAIESASQTYFGKPAMYHGEGGSIPFMHMLGELFPAAQFVITGVLGPRSNAHGPNEFLHLPMAKKLTGCVAEILAMHSKVV